MAGDLDEIFGTDTKAETLVVAASSEDLDSLDLHLQDRKITARVDAEIAAERAAKVVREATEATEAAKAAGLTDDEIASIGDDASLAKFIAILQRKAAVEGDGRAVAAAEAATAGLAGGATTDAGEIPGSPELDAILAANPDDAVDPEAMRGMQALAKAMKERLAVPSPSKQAPSVDAGALDGLLAGLDPMFDSTFGGRDIVAGDLAENSPARLMRRQMVEETERIKSKARAEKRAVPTTKDAFQQALRALHGEKVILAKQRATAAKVEERSGQIIARPNGAKSDLPAGRAKAIESVQRLLAERAR